MKADEAFLEPIERFRREQIGSAKEAKKKFEKETAKYCQNLERYLNLSVKKSETQLLEVRSGNEVKVLTVLTSPPMTRPMQITPLNIGTFFKQCPIMFSSYRR